MPDLFQLNFSQLVDIGRKKENNEDYVTFFVPQKKGEINESGSLFILADGVGGASRGEIASQYAADRVLYEYYQNTQFDPGSRLVKAFEKANEEIHTYAGKNGHYTQMATTLVAAAVHNNQLVVANVGDSRAYLIRQGQIKQITNDHSVVAEMVRSGSMTEKEAQFSNIRNRLSRSIGGEARVMVDIFPPIQLELGDKILLCSDGLSRYAGPEDLLKMTAEKKLEDAAQRLIRFANHQGGADNISVSLIEVVQKASSRKEHGTDHSKPPKFEEWQDADTIIENSARPGRKKKAALIPILAVGLPLLALLIFLLIFFADKVIEKLFSPQPTAPDQNVLILTTESPMEGIAEVAEENNADQQMLEASPSPSPQEASGSTEEPNSRSVEAAEDQNSLPSPVTNGEKWECVYQVQEKDSEGADAILKNFGVDRKYQHYEAGECEIKNDNEEYVICTGESKDFTDTKEYIYPGQWLVIKDKDEEEITQDECLENSGKIHVINSGGEE